MEMNETASKKDKSMAIIRIFQILYKYTNTEMRLKQETIVDILDKKYGIFIKRKSVSAKISILKNSLADDGIIIKTGSRGSYIASRPFSNEEINLLINAVTANQQFSESALITLENKIRKLSDVQSFPLNSNKESLRDKNAFHNINIIMEAIQKKVAIKFFYRHYGFDKEFEYPGTEHVVYPFKLILHGRNYYVIAYNKEYRDYTAFHIDHINNIEKQDIPLSLDLQCKVFDNLPHRPFIFCDKDEYVEFILRDLGLMDNIIDTFGKKNIKTSVLDDKSAKISLNTSILAMKKWALQNLDAIEVIYPKKLRDKIKADIAKAMQMYQ